MKVVAIIQARMGSTRLPGKVLRRLGNATVLEHVVRRVRAATNIDEVIIATTEWARDDVIAESAGALGAKVFRGSEEDVLSRYYFAAKGAAADIVVRVTSDCPLLDPELLRAMVERFLSLRREGAEVHYLSNTLTRTYPRGLDVEIFTFAALEDAHHQAKAQTEREHVTPYLYRHPEKFRVEHHRAQLDLSHLRWTLDTENDWQMLKQIFDRLDSSRAYFPTSEVISLLAREPQLAGINAHVEQKAVGH